MRQSGNWIVVVHPLGGGGLPGPYPAQVLRFARGQPEPDAGFALQQFARVYDVEREVKDLDSQQLRVMRQQQTKPLLDALHQWMLLQRRQVPDGSATAKALDYSLRR